MLANPARLGAFHLPCRKPMRPTFDYANLLALLGPASSRFDLDHLSECDSTNSELLRRASAGAPAGLVLVCDTQSAGRGRRGKRWISSPESSLTFSLLWRLPAQCAPSGLSLVVGLALAEALDSLAGCRSSLKWPNDIWLEGRKLGGILIEAVPGCDTLSLVIGIGLNLRLDPAWNAGVNQAITALDAAGCNASRETVLAAILERLASMLDRFAEEGFSGFRNAWQARNALSGLLVDLISEHEKLSGICAGVSEDGALILEVAGERKLINAGDVSLRPHLEAI